MFFPARPPPQSPGRDLPGRAMPRLPPPLRPVLRLHLLLLHLRGGHGGEDVLPGRGLAHRHGGVGARPAERGAEERAEVIAIT